MSVSPEVSRRAFLGAAAAVVTGIILSETVWSDDGSSHQAHPTAEPDPATPSPTEVYSTAEYPLIFGDGRATEVAKSLAITPATYYVVTAEAMKKSSQANHLLDQKLLPIFMPGVTRYAEELQLSAEANNVPVNMLAIIMSMESAGNPEAHSGDDAWSLMQIVPYYWFDAFVQHGFLPSDATLEDYHRAIADHPSAKKSKYAKEVYTAAFSDPAQNILIGGEIMADALQRAQAAGGYNQNDLTLYTRAAGVYNDGPDAASASYDQLPVQTQLYMDHFIRMVLDVNIAGELRAQGLPDDQILRAMQSSEMDARAFAYAESATYRSNSNYLTYEACNELCALPTPGDSTVAIATSKVLRTDINGAYKAYREDRAEVPNSTTGHYLIPAPPGLRIWMSSGGSDLLGQLDMNVAWRLP